MHCVNSYLLLIVTVCLFIRTPLIIACDLCLDSIPHERKGYLQHRNTMDLFIPICF